MVRLARSLALGATLALLGCNSNTESAFRATEFVRERVDQSSAAEIRPLLFSVSTLPTTSAATTTRSSSAPATTSVSTTAPSTQPSFHWVIEWQGWDGLYIEAVQKTKIKNPEEVFGAEAPHYLQWDEVKFSSRIGARIEVDGAAFNAHGDLAGFDDGVQLRRAYINAKGDFELILPVSYDLQIGYIPSEFYVNKAQFTLPHIDYIGYPEFGIFTPPMGLDIITSSRDIVFMEPAAPLQAMAPGNEWGLQIGQPVLDQRATWALGIFGSGPFNNSEYGNASENYGNLIGRVTCLGIDHIDQAHPANNELLHLGISSNVQYSTTATVRYKSKPESYIAPVVIDTGDINASAAGMFGTELSYVHGPFTFQTEFVDSVVGVNGSDNVNFFGTYAYVSWFVTGESRSYDRYKGDFGRIIPLRDFKWNGHGQWGAFELACRYSYTDLSDGGIDGGRLSEVMGALNWFLQPHLRWLFNIGYANVSGGPQDGQVLIFQTRVGVDF